MKYCNKGESSESYGLVLSCRHRYRGADFPKLCHSSVRDELVKITKDTNMRYYGYVPTL